MTNGPENGTAYEVEKTVEGAGFVHFIRRVDDGEQFIAKQFDAERAPELLDLRRPKPDDRIVSYEAAARVLNHENLISVVKSMWTAPVIPLAEGGVSEEWSVVHEWCADGSLQQIFDKPPVEPTEQGFLPEGLVWHVALSMLRALAYLHEGWRQKVTLLKSGQRVNPSWYKVDDDWMPILHRDIEPENIYFQARKGKESYGLCKLGNFSRCFVAGTASDPLTEGSAGVLATLNNLAQSDPSLEEIRRFWKEGHKNGTAHWRDVRPSQRVYTTGSELAALGEVLYRMMKGKRLRAGEECFNCGCFHVDPTPPGCHCICPFDDVYLDEEFRKMTKYSGGLREVVVGLVRMNHDHRASARGCYDAAWTQYLKWRVETADGYAHIDHYADLFDRKALERRRRLEQRKRELGDDRMAERELAAQAREQDLLVWE